MFKEELIIIRHGRSKQNVGESLNMDDGLTDFGKRQSFNVGRYLCEGMKLKRPCSFYTSPFLRCLETSREIERGMAAYLNSGQVPPAGMGTQNQFLVTPDLREYINHFSGGKEVIVEQRSSEFGPFDWGLYSEQPFKDEFNETFLDRMVRVHDFLKERSVVVTHGLPAFVLLYVATTVNPRHVPLWDYSLDNASITWIKKGRVIWHGKNLYHELENERPWPDDCNMKEILQ